MSTFTTTKQLEEVARGADVGTWDTPTNSNWSIVDAALGQIATQSLNNTPVILNAAQFQCCQLVFNSTLTGNVSITFPTSFTGPYVIQNNCTGSSAFVITLQTTAAGGQIVGCPFGEIFDVFNDGTNIKFRNFGRIGTYEDWMVSALPGWVTACTVPPYLNCIGGSFSSAVYPTLAVMLGGTTLPDTRSKVRIPLAQGATVVSSSGSGVAAGTLGATGGDQLTQAHTHTSSGVTTVESNDHTHTLTAMQQSVTAVISGGGAFLGNNVGITTSGVSATHTHSFTVTTGSAGGGAAQNMPPVYVGGITVVRAG